LRRFQRATTGVEIGCHPPEGGEHRLKLDRRLALERRLPLSGRNRESCAAQRSYRLRELARRCAAQQERRECADGRREQYENAKVAAAPIDRHVAWPSRRGEDE
jgi:hypothetical protein